MSRPTFSIAAMGMVLTAALFAAGCTSDKPAALTGTDQVSTAATAQERLAYTDQKGHYRPDLAIEGRTTR